MQQVRLGGLPTPQLEVHFHPTRRWRFDLAGRNTKSPANTRADYSFRKADTKPFAGCATIGRNSTKRSCSAGLFFCSVLTKCEPGMLSS